MRLGADDVQLARHAFGQLAEMMFLLSESLKEAGFETEMRDKMVLEWWKLTVTTTQGPDFVDLFTKLLESGEGGE